MANCSGSGPYPSGLTSTSTGVAPAIRIASTSATKPFAIALERSDGSVSVFHTRVGDDEALNRRYAERLLKFLLWQKGGYRITVAGDPAIADCGCIIIDQNMPAMTGLDTVTSLRNRAISVPVILITTQPSEMLTQRAANAGVPIVEKPLLGNALVDRIRLAVAEGPARPAR